VNLIALAAAAALRLLDPTGDAAGDGTLMPPTSPAYADLSVFDLQEVALVPGAVEGEPATLAVAMGSIERSEAMPGGFNRVVVDVYVDDGPGGAEATLTGPGMLMPQGRGWEYAVRVSPRGAFGAVAPLDPAVPVEWQPLPLSIDGDVFVVTLPWALTDDAEAYAVSGLFDAFSPTDWRELSRTPSPWSFSSAEQVPSVVDVLAADQEAQVRAVSSGVLPAPVRPRDTGLPWLLLALAGVVIAMAGLWLRRRVPAASVGEPVRAAEDEEDLAEVTADAEERPEATAAGAPADEAEAAARDEVAAAEEGEAAVADADDDTAAEAAEPAIAAGDEPREVGEGLVGAEAPELDTDPAPAPDAEAKEPAEDVTTADRAGARSDPLGAGWGDEDGEAEEDDLAAFVAGEGRRRGELVVEMSDEEDE